MFRQVVEARTFVSLVASAAVWSVQQFQMRFPEDDASLQLVLAYRPYLFHGATWAKVMTIHANSAQQAIQRFTSRVLQSTVELPCEAVRSNLAESLNRRCHIERQGKRYVAQLVELKHYSSGSGKGICTGKDDHGEPGCRAPFSSRELPARRPIGHRPGQQEKRRRTASVEEISGEEFQRWLRHINASQYEVYLSIDNLEPGARGRTKADIGQIRHIHLDLDEDGPDALKSLLEPQDLPRPNDVLSTSPDKFQIVRNADVFSKDRAENLRRGLAREADSDPAATDCARVLRFRGFYNQKYEQPHYVRVDRLSDPTTTPEQFPARQEDATHRSPNGAVRAPRAEHRDAGHISQSEPHWAHARRALARGTPQDQVIEEIARCRPNKTNPRCYAEHTAKQGRSMPAANQARHTAGVIGHHAENDYEMEEKR